MGRPLGPRVRASRPFPCVFAPSTVPHLAIIWVVGAGAARARSGESAVSIDPPTLPVTHPSPPEPLLPVDRPARASTSQIRNRNRRLAPIGVPLRVPSLDEPDPELSPLHLQCRRARLSLPSPKHKPELHIAVSSTDTRQPLRPRTGVSTMALAPMSVVTTAPLARRATVAHSPTLRGWTDESLSPTVL